MITHNTNRSRRTFLINLARAGVLLPFAGQLLGRSAFAQVGGARRVLFLYYPNGTHAVQWRPEQTTGSITQSTELSFGLGPLAPWHNRLIVLRNLYLEGVPAGGHTESIQNCMAGKAGLAANEATVDHVLARALGSEVLNLGVRTGQNAAGMVSKPYDIDSAQRPIPNNDPADAAAKIARQIGGGGGGSSEETELKRQMYEALLSDFDDLANATLEAAAQTKLETHEAALRRLRDQLGTEIGACGFTETAVSDPYAAGGTGTDYEHFRLIPDIAKAQIDNALGVLACEINRVATVQLFKGDEHASFANYSFEECWQHIEAAGNQGIGGGNVPNRWWNEHSSHTASHGVFASHAGQVRWYHQLLAYTLEQLQAKGILDDTLVVMLSDVGDGNNHGPYEGSVTVAGGAGGSLQMGRIIDCGDGTIDGAVRHTTKELFVDIGSLLGVDVSTENGWGYGGVIL